MKKHLLFTDTTSADHGPILRAVRERGYEPILLGGPLLECARATGQSVRDASDFITPEFLHTVQTETARVAASLQDAIRAPGSKAGLDSTLGDWLKRSGKLFFQQAVTSASEQIQALELLHAIRAGVRIEGIVASDKPTAAERALLFAARQLGLPSIQLTRELVFSSDHIQADHLCVPGHRLRDALLEEDFPSNRIHVTGHPAWDTLHAKESQPARDNARARLGLDSRRPVLCFLANAKQSPRAAEELFLALLKACRDLPIAPQLIVHQDPCERAPHPDMTWSRLEEFLRAWAHDIGQPIAHIATTDRNDAIRAADIVVTSATSSVLAEALLLERPVLAVSVTPHDDHHVDNEAGVLIAHSPAEIATRLKQFFASAELQTQLERNRQSRAESWSIGRDGQSAARIAHVIDNVTQDATRWRGGVLRTLKGRERSRILMVAHDFFPFGKAGTERYTRDLSRALVDRGHDVRVFHPRPILRGDNEYRIEEDFVEGLPVTRLLLPITAPRTTHLEFIKPAVKQILADHKIEIVHAQHLMSLGPSFIEAVKQAGLPFILTANDFWSLCEQIHLMRPEGGVCTGPETIDKCVQCVRRRQSVLEEHVPRAFYLLADRHYTNKRAIRAVDLVICPSKFLRDTYQRHGFEGRQLVHLPQGANLEAPLPRRQNTQGKIIFRYLGHVAYRKGLDLLVRAFNRVEGDRAELHIHGINAEPRYLEQILASVSKDKTVIYHGEYTPDQMPLILAETDIAVVPSRGENFPFVIREILHHRVPVIASDVAGIPEIVQDGINGRLFPSEDHDRLRAILQQLCDQPELMERLRAGITPIKSMANDAADIESLYREVQGDTGSSEGINLVLIAPEPNAAILAHREMAEILARGLQEAGLAAQVVVNRVQPKAINLLVGAANLPSLDLFAM